MLELCTGVPLPCGSTPHSLRQEHLGLTQLLVFELPTPAEIPVRKHRAPEGLVRRTTSAYQNLISSCSNLLEGPVLELDSQQPSSVGQHSVRHLLILAVLLIILFHQVHRCNLRFDRFSANSPRAREQLFNVARKRDVTDAASYAAAAPLLFWQPTGVTPSASRALSSAGSWDESEGTFVISW